MKQKDSNTATYLEKKYLLPLLYESELLKFNPYLLHYRQKYTN